MRGEIRQRGQREIRVVPVRFEPRREQREEGRHAGEPAEEGHAQPAIARLGQRCDQPAQSARKQHPVHRVDGEHEPEHVLQPVGRSHVAQHAAGARVDREVAPAGVEGLVELTRPREPGQEQEEQRQEQGSARKTKLRSGTGFWAIANSAIAGARTITGPLSSTARVNSSRPPT